MRALARVLARVREVIIQDEQNPLRRILLADQFETLADPLFRLVFWEAHHALSIQGVEPDRWFEDLHQRSFKMRIIDVPQPLGIVERLRVGSVEESENSAAIRTDIIVNDPAFLVITVLFVVWFVGVVVVERVADALVNDLFCIIRS